MLYQTKNPHGGDIYEQDITLDFSANTNPFGTPEGVKRAIAASLDDLHRYPDPYCRKLVRAIAAHEQIPEEFVLCGNGAAELIYAFCQALKPQKAMELAPTFSEYSLGLMQTGGEMIRYTLREEQGFALDEEFLAFLIGEKPQVLFLCNPNNPTGQLIPQDLMKRILLLCREQNIRVFLDECFLDLTENGISQKNLLSKFPNLIILKAFTKSYGMAGVRLGYCMSADAALLAEMAASVQPWNVSTVAQTAGTAALQESAFLEKTLALIAQERPRLQSELEELEFTVVPSCANYLLFRADPALGDALRQKKIAVRSCANYHGLGVGWYRIAVKLPEENRALLAAIHAVCEKE